MKLRHALFALLLACFALNFAFAQKKDEKSAQNSIEVRANVNVLNAAGSSDGDVKLEDLKVFEDGVEQKITYFVKKENVLNLGFVMDNTGSMRMLLEEVIEAGSRFINTLTGNDKAFIVRFVDSSKIELVQDWSSDKRILNLGMNQLFVEGGQSAVIDALYTAVELKLQPAAAQNPNQRYAILLISDCEDRASYYKIQQLLALTKGKNIQIFPLALTFNLAGNSKKRAEYLSNKLALETGGTAFVMSSRKDKNNITDMLKAIAGELRSPYIVGYTSTNTKRDDSPRKLTVQVADNAKGEKRQGVIRDNFVVPKD